MKFSILKVVFVMDGLKLGDGFVSSANCLFKVSVKENEVPTEKNSTRASIFATKASYISN